MAPPAASWASEGSTRRGWRLSCSPRLQTERAHANHHPFDRHLGLGRDKRSLSLANEQVAIEVPDLSLFYGQKQALHNVSMNIPRQRVTAFIGPSGCGKSTCCAASTA